MRTRPHWIRKLCVALAVGLPIAIVPAYRSLATVSNQATQTVTAMGTGAVVNYTIGFSFQSNNDVHVYLEDQSTSPYTRTEVIQGAGASKFTVTGGDPGTTVHMGTAPSTVQRLIIKRVMAFTQTVGYVETEAFPASSHEAAMDKQVMLEQQLQSEVDLKVGLGSTSTATTPTLPDPVVDRFLVYNHAGSDLTLAPVAGLSLSSGDVLRYNGSAWVQFGLTNALSTLTNGLSAHLADTSNPHVVTAAQVGSAVAQWNASKIQGVTVDDSSKADGFVLQYSLSGTKLIYSPAPLSPTLASAHIFVGNVSNSATDVAVSGDLTLANTGAFSVATVGASSAANLHAAELAANAATATNTINTIVKRNGSGAANLDTAGTHTGAVVGNADTATALAADPSDCAAGNLANVIAANGSLSCVQVTDTYVAAGAAIARSKVASGSNDHVVINSGAGVMSSEATLAKVRGGMAQDNSSLTFPTTGTVPAYTPTNHGVVVSGSAAAATVTSAGTSGQVMTSNGASADPTFQASQAANNSYLLQNLGLAASVGSSALTISLKQADGSTAPAAGAGAVTIGFRSSTATTGGYSLRTATAATSLVISSGSTLGQVSATAEYVYVYAIDNAGTVELAASTSNMADNGSVVTTTAEGGAGAADARGTIYSTTARSNVPVRLIGRMKSTQATAGTWASSPDEISIAPLTGGAVISNAVTPRIEWLTLSVQCTASPCTIATQSGVFTSVTRAATGNYTANIAAGVFSSAPACTFTAVNSSANFIALNGSPSTTAIPIFAAVTSTTALADGMFHMICVGPR